jgi:hypothetical protein
VVDARCGRRRQVRGAIPHGENGLVVALVRAGVRLGGQARVGCRSSLRRGRSGMMGFAVHWPAGSITYGATTPRGGGHDLHDPRRPGKSRGGVHATLGRCSRART